MNALRNWQIWASKHSPSIPFWNPSANQLGEYLISGDKRGPTVARGIWTQLDWVRRELGGAFPTDSSLLASFRLHAVGHLPTPAVEMPPGVFLAITNLSSTTQGAVAMFGGLVVLLAVACLRWRHQARSIVQHLNEKFITGKCLLGKSKVQGQRRAFAWRVPQKVGLCFSILDRVFVLLTTLYVENPNLCSLVPDFASDTLSPSSNWLPKPMSYGKFMRTFRSFLELLGVPKKEARGVKYNYIRRFLVDTTEAQSLSNWIEISHGRYRREARASHPTSRHYAGDKLTSSGLVKAMCVEALCQAVPCDKRDCRKSLLSITWFHVRVALPDLDQAWQRALHGLKEFSTHTSDHFPKGKVVVETVPSHREMSTASHAADPFRLFDMTDAPEVAVHRDDLITSTVPQPSADDQFQPLKEDIQGFYTIMPGGKHVPKDSHRRNSKKAHIILAEITASSFIPYCQSNPFQNECVKMLATDFSGAAWCQRCIKRWKSQNCATTQSTLT